MRMDDDRLVLRVVKALYENTQEGNILIDDPTSKRWEELKEKAKDLKIWRQEVRQIKDIIHIQVKDGSKTKEEGKKQNGRKNGADVKKRKREQTGDICRCPRRCG